jgi:XTP/dITP diphosphohydrolase
MRLLLATRNIGKLRELQSLLADLPLQCTSLDEVGIDTDIPEVGETFYENASLKARGYAHLSGLATLADDSGLEVRALAGAPGVRSARWAGPHATDRDRIQRLLARLQSLPPRERQAQFHCVAAVATPDGRLYTAEGVVCGLIVDEPRGSYGFGYDPVFLVADHGLTMAELPPEVKNRISHRARAIRAIRSALEELLAEEKKGRSCA